MKTTKNNSIIKSQANPDIAKESYSKIKTSLDLVGMSNVELPILINDAEGHVMTVPAKCDLFVSLDDPHAKGIHMSRLYLNAQEHFAAHTLSFESLKQLTDIFVESHKDLSFASEVKVSFDYMTKRPALISKQSGWRFYPANFSIKRNARAQVDFKLDFEILYSSTCPCSAALARQINHEAFLNKFGSQSQISTEDISAWIQSEASQSAVPHAQRSKAIISLGFDQVLDKLDIEYWIDLVENTLKTPVQTAVKREDEKEFAKLNGENFMFSEDACRLIKAAIEKETQVKSYTIKVVHEESLHPHDAVAIAYKNVN